MIVAIVVAIAVAANVGQLMQGSQTTAPARDDYALRHPVTVPAVPVVRDDFGLRHPIVVPAARDDFGLRRRSPPRPRRTITGCGTSRPSSPIPHTLPGGGRGQSAPTDPDPEQRAPDDRRPFFLCPRRLAPVVDDGVVRRLRGPWVAACASVIALTHAACTATPVTSPAPATSTPSSAPTPTAPGPTGTTSASPTDGPTPAPSGPAASATPPAASPTATPEPSAAGALTLTEFDVPRGSHPHDVAPAADGGVWYTAQDNGTLGHLDPATGDGARGRRSAHGSAPHGVIVGPTARPGSPTAA